MNDLRWLSPSAPRSPSVEVSGEHSMVRFAGLAEIADAQGLDAADFARTHAGSFLAMSASMDFAEERVLSRAATVLPNGASVV